MTDGLIINGDGNIIAYLAIAEDPAKYDFALFGLGAYEKF